MRMSLNRKQRPAAAPGPRPRGGLFTRVGAGAALFFTFKGVVWLAVGGLALAGVL